MKKQILSMAVIIIAAAACKKNVDPKFDGRPAFAGPYVDTVVLPLVINTDQSLASNVLYILDGKTYVTGNAELTIDEGTRIEAKKKSTNDSASALIITRGSKLTAIGSDIAPIVFTSHETNPAAGDWGGIVILGSAPLNRADTTIEGINLPSVPGGVDVNYGGGGAGLGDANDNSGTLDYVRIEYAGAAVATDNELNGLTLGGVGRGTTLDHIEVALGNDDAFEFFGGTVDAKHLIAFSPDDDAFDFDFGYTGRIQFAVSVLRSVDNFSANPNGIESDNNATGANTAPRTKAVISNLTVLGLETSSDATSHGLLNGAHYRRRSSYTVRNSVFAGFPTGIRFDSDSTQADVNKFQYNTVHAFTTVDLNASIDATNTEILGGTANASLALTDPFNTSAPNFKPSSSSPLLTASTSFTGLPNTPAFFNTAATFRGAFAGSGAESIWDSGWAKYNY